MKTLSGTYALILGALVLAVLLVGTIAYANGRDRSSTSDARFAALEVRESDGGTSETGGNDAGGSEGADGANGGATGDDGEEGTTEDGTEETSSGNDAEEDAERVQEALDESGISDGSFLGSFTLDLGAETSSNDGSITVTSSILSRLRQ